ncbi:FAD-dependent oxidoreductase [Tichowtungia aerotolerans]|uniref:FAD-dependent oxidoreductase n=1 Tax=Tichowtungia aerotolerans TaxID=2697043 RepID=A0A6P1MG49_9BACT|nr:FAD-dependent oxidoreductase [Tichowtungia aerotolerans]QHI70055.1 FAD-dependent oxidoreductase [Tichowtungia aerotolerans]
MAKVVVVGVNHAGTSAIRTLLSQNKNHEVVAFDRNNNISFLGCGIALTVSGVVQNVNDLFYSNCNELETLGAEVHMSTDVTKIDTDKKEVTAKNLETGNEMTVGYDKLIYAAGSWPVDFNIPNSDLDNIYVCKLFQHAATLIDKANEPGIESVAIIGAGYIGIELAEAYHQKGKKVTLVDLQERVVPAYFDTEFTDRLQADIRRSGVNLVLGARVTGYIGGENGQVKQIETNHGNYDADLVIQCVGFKPNTDLLEDAEKLPNGALVVDSCMRTTVPDVYAIGDTAAIYHSAVGAHRHVALATNAVKGGVVAASQINELYTVQLPSIAGTNAICVFGNMLASTGLSEAAARAEGMNVLSSFYVDNDRPEFMNDVEEVGVKLVYDKESLRLVGAQIGSYGNTPHTECIFYLSLAIQKGLTLPELAMTDVYFLPHFNKPFNFVISAILQALGLTYMKG